jgi:hypothetical protein
VNFGGMKMAWIGLIDPTGNIVRPVAASGSGTEYLAQLQIKLDGDDAASHGPTATTIRTEPTILVPGLRQRPDPPRPGASRAGIYGWAASAALPLHREGVVIGAFSLYADETWGVR